MRQLKKAGTWFLLLNKRFLKKYIFSALLLSVPVLVIGLRIIAQEESGILRVLLYQESGDVPKSASVMEELLEKDGVICYERVEEREYGCQQVRLGKADCFWILPADLTGQIRSFLNGEAESVIQVYVREDTVWTKLAREQLYGALYPVFSYEITRNFLTGEESLEFVDSKELEEKIQYYYEENGVSGSLLQFAYLDDADYDSFREENSYLITPLRGMLALMLLLCGLAVTMFYMQDEKDGLFLWMPIKNRKRFPVRYTLIGLFDAGVAVYLGLLCSGTFTQWQREWMMLCLYIITAGLFCNILRVLCKNVRAMGAVMPILLIVSLVLCPVFLNIRRFPLIQYLLPTYYYLNSVHSDWMIRKNIVYVAGLILVNLILDKKNVGKYEISDFLCKKTVDS